MSRVINGMEMHDEEEYKRMHRVVRGVVYPYEYQRLISAMVVFEKEGVFFAGRFCMTCTKVSRYGTAEWWPEFYVQESAHYDTKEGVDAFIQAAKEYGNAS